MDNPVKWMSPPCRDSGKARDRVAALLLLLLPALLLTLSPSKARAQEDDIVPEGAWHHRYAYQREVHDASVDRLSNKTGLIDYLIPDPGLRAQAGGRIDRKVERYLFLFNYGLSDGWNVSIDLPYVMMEQESTVTYDSTLLEEHPELAGLGPDSVSGMGAVRLTSRHRTVFSDRNGFLWGYGMEAPGDGQKSPYVGLHTLDLSQPAPLLFTFFHYTRYPSSAGRARFDLRSEGALGLSRTVDTPSGGKGLDRGNEARVNIGWTQEAGPFTLGAETEFAITMTSTLQGKRLSDSSKLWVNRLLLGFGNMEGLESAPIGFPYRLTLQGDFLFQGRNVPRGSSLALALETYF